MTLFQVASHQASHGTLHGMSVIFTQGKTALLEGADA